jgi:hypothetical protein
LKIIFFGSKFMKTKVLNLFFLLFSFLIVGALACHASLVFSDTFTAANGTALVGHTPDSGGGAWFNVSSSVNPLTINNNSVSLANNGADDGSTFSSAIAANPGTSIFVGASISVSAVGSGDYFLSVRSATAQDAQLYAKSTTGGYLLGLATSSGATTVYGSTVLNLGTQYQIVMEYDSVSGSANDTMALYVNPISGQGNNATYVTETGTGGLDPSSFTGILFRQGTAGQAPALTADNLSLGTSFDDIIPVPEPAEWGLFSGVGLFGICGLREWRLRRQKNWQKQI